MVNKRVYELDMRAIQRFISATHRRNKVVVQEALQQKQVRSQEYHAALREEWYTGMAQHMAATSSEEDIAWALHRQRLLSENETYHYDGHDYEEWTRIWDQEIIDDDHCITEELARLRALQEKERNGRGRRGRRGG